ncbi:hypothetical protein PHISCL_09969 [Aspergillus sclerotialis]|uniref:Uncharacterized protein n=1 Tax=Aspergillus sclerotialis TaxID=2070753 RepID=A0A3A2ZII9_9EURO|nr:hypothetical protein PHISCL_09969 [Aspergillus sclerotialis]
MKSGVTRNHPTTPTGKKPLAERNQKIASRVTPLSPMRIFNNNDHRPPCLAQGHPDPSDHVPDGPDNQRQVLLRRRLFLRRVFGNPPPSTSDARGAPSPLSTAPGCVEES